MKKDKLARSKGLLERICHFFSLNKEGISEELKISIEACKNMEELKELLFSCGLLNETAMALFDRKIEELERTT